MLCFQGCQIGQPENLMKSSPVCQFLDLNMRSLLLNWEYFKSILVYIYIITLLICSWEYIDNSLFLPSFFCGWVSNIEQLACQKTLWRPGWKKYMPHNPQSINYGELPHSFSTFTYKIPCKHVTFLFSQCWFKLCFTHFWPMFHESTESASR
jgi:hypothetical protein